SPIGCDAADYSQCAIVSLETSTGCGDVQTDSPLEREDLPPMIKRKKRGDNPARHSVLQCLQGKGSTVLALSIGIGGHLAMPPLPHHRAYGSVPRRFGGLSAHQLFHGKQAQTTEASFGKGAMQSFREAQPPGSLWAEDGR